MRRVLPCFVLPLAAALTLTDVAAAQAPFSDATTPLLADAQLGRGVAWVDYDDDGDLDLMLANYNSPNRLFRNDGGTWVDATHGPLTIDGQARGVSWGDYDNDGDVDLYMTYHNEPNRLIRNDGGVLVNATSGPLGNAGSSQMAPWADYDNDGDLDLYLSNDGQANKLFRNDGGAWVDATTGPLGDPNKGCPVLWADYDNDGDQDIYLGNRGQADKLFRNDGGTWADVTTGPLADPAITDGGAWGDYDNDGDLDLYISNEDAPNRLVRNDGGSWANVATGPVADAGNGRGATFFDYDNDGDLDLYLSNVGPNKLIRNDGGAWADVTTPLLGDSGHGGGLTTGDYDLDGDLDLYLSNHLAPNKLFRNESSPNLHWLEVELTGQTTNRSAIGARVRVVAAGTSQIREITAGTAGTSQNWLTTHFGLGVASTIDSLIIQWPKHRQVVSPAPAVDQLVKIVEEVPEAAKILSVLDVPNDQGSAVRLTIGASDLDVGGGVIAYDVWRRVDPLTAVETSTPPSFPRASGSLPPGMWELLGSFDATKSEEYLFVATTLADSPFVSVFAVTARTPTPAIWFSSQSGSGASVDNLAPGTPQDFVAFTVDAGVGLQWTPADEPDLDHYRIHRGAMPMFEVEPASLVYTGGATEWTDTHPNSETLYYKLVAVDRQGNESAPAGASITFSLAANPTIPTRFSLGAPSPNPFRASMTLRLDLPRRANLRLDVFDLTGRKVRTLRSGPLSAGAHEAIWDGAGDDGRALPVGTYVVRMQADDFVAVRRAVLMR